MPARVGRSVTLLIGAHVAFVVLFVAGGALSIWTFARNSQTSVNCAGGLGGACGHHSYVLGVTLLAVGFVGNLLTMAIGARLAVGYGVEAFGYLRTRGSSAPVAPHPPPDRVGGQPPGTPGSPTGPPL